MKRGDILVTKDTDCPLIPEEALFDELVNRNGHLLFRVSKIKEVQYIDGLIGTEVSVVHLQHNTETHVPLEYAKMRFKVYMTAEQALAERLMA